MWPMHPQHVWYGKPAEKNMPEKLCTGPRSKQISKSEVKKTSGIDNIQAKISSLVLILGIIRERERNFPV